jgi:type III pantothenate kinase
LAVWRLATHRHATADELSVTFDSLILRRAWTFLQLRGVAVASVVPPLDPVYRDLSEKHFKQVPLFVEAGVKTGVKILYDSPAEVGADRVVNAAAAYARVRGPLIVVDFGTATTFDCVDKAGAYLGGAIAPGPQMAAETLYQRTAKLPLLGAFHQPPRPLARTPKTALLRAFFTGMWASRGVSWLDWSKKWEPNQGFWPPGGLATLLAPSLPEINDVVPDLTLEGTLANLVIKCNIKSEFCG